MVNCEVLPYFVPIKKRLFLPTDEERRNQSSDILRLRTANDKKKRTLGGRILSHWRLQLFLRLFHTWMAISEEFKWT